MGKNDELLHVGVMGMHWGRRKGESTHARLLREAHPKKVPTLAKVGIGVGIGAGILLTPWPIGLTVAVASSAYFSNRAATQHKAQLALAKMGKTKIKNLPKKSAYQDLQDGLKQLDKSGQGNNEKAAIALAAKYDKARKAEKQLYGANAPTE